MLASPHNINWMLFGEAALYYNRMGYKYIEVPWRVGEQAVLTTIPYDLDLEIYPDRSNLVGSAEQSFVQMMIDRTLSHGKYQAVSPCFRNEPVIDALHQNHFMKLELIQFGDVSESSLKSMIDHANYFFQLKLHSFKTNIVKTELGYDIEHDGIEIGSYGIRKKIGFEWIYGTGIAEPRFSFASEENI
jgi:seryl-tRNA synthetase